MRSVLLSYPNPRDIFRTLYFRREDLFRKQQLIHGNYEYLMRKITELLIWSAQNLGLAYFAEKQQRRMAMHELLDDAIRFWQGDATMTSLLQNELRIIESLSRQPF